MKNFFTIIILFGCISVGFGQTKGNSKSTRDELFFDGVTKVDCRDCPYVSLNVSSDKYSGRVVISSGLLARYVMETKGLSEKQYLKFIKKLLRNNSSLALENVKMERSISQLTIARKPKVESIYNTEYRFDIPIPMDEVSSVASKGCRAFIKYYFLEEDIENESPSDLEDSYKFINERNKTLFLRSSSSAYPELATIVNQLFDWRIRVDFEHYSGFPYIFVLPDS